MSIAAGRPLKKKKLFLVGSSSPQNLVACNDWSGELERMQELCPSARLLDDILGKGGPKKPLRDAVIAHRTDVPQLAAAEAPILTNIKKALAGQYDAPIGLDLVPANHHIQKAQAPRSISSSLSNRLNTADEELVLMKAQQILKDRLKQVAEEAKTFCLQEFPVYLL